MQYSRPGALPHGRASVTAAFQRTFTELRASASGHGEFCKFLQSTPRHHRFVFLGFAAEEEGLVGSSSFVHELPSGEFHQIHAMINLECLGLGPPEIWLSRADERLRDAYAAVAKVLSIPLIGMNVDRVSDDDSHSFIRVGIPVLTIHSLNSDTIHLIHRPADKVSAIHPDEYYATYRLVARVSRVCRYRDPVGGPVRYRARPLTVAAL